MTKKNNWEKLGRLGTIEKQYKVDFGKRSDMKLETYLKQEGFSSLSKVLSDLMDRMAKKKKK